MNLATDPNHKRVIDGALIHRFATKEPRANLLSEDTDWDSSLIACLKMPHPRLTDTQPV